jgi:hypothetical protein
MNAHIRKLLGKQLLLLLLVAALLSSYPASAQTASASGHSQNNHNADFSIPRGTVLPVRLNHGFSSKNAQPGQRISAGIMQDVPLPSGRIPHGATVSGSIVSVEPARNGNPGKISFRFDTLENSKKKIPVKTNLRAIAGFMEVLEAQTPETSPGFGTPSPWITTRQIGGDEVYGVGGPVTNTVSEHVGKAIFGGVLVHVRANPGSNCRGPLDDNDQLQALWVFSADACGVYGIDGVTIEHAGRTEPTGEITLTSEHGNISLRGGTAMLLRTD